MSQTERIFFIDRRMRDRGGVTVSQISQTFEVCARQAKRDIEYMRDRLNAPIAWSSPHRRYEYSEQWEGLRFADEKSLLALSFLRSILSQYHYVPVLSEELVALAQEKLGGRYAAIADKVIYELSDMETLDNEVSFSLCQALLNASHVSIDYTDAKGSPSQRDIRPVRLVNYAGKWYCIALDSTSGELRTFAVSRIRRADGASGTAANLEARVQSDARSPQQQADDSPGAVARTPAPPATPDCAADVATNSRPEVAAASAIDEAEVERYLSSSYGIFKGKPIGRATLRFYGGAARAVHAQVWHKDQVMAEVTAPGAEPALDLTLPVHDWTELLGRALRCGSSCEVMGPPEFRRLWVEEIRAMGNMLCGETV